ncbi:MAG: ribonuclease E/G, partial [Alphaproteobacteria bacterium]|nr:ribonuclease E/G [Alphaproteobacteria bacterium]
MSKKGLDTLVEFSPGETRAARVDEDGVLYELLIERAGQKSLVGNLYLGKVTRVEKGMDAVFVDIGLDEPGLINKAKGLDEGKVLIVQVTRDARDDKGVALTRHPVLMDRYFTLTPGRKGINWARAVGKGRDRAHLEAVLPTILGEKTDGFSVRGPAVAVGENVLQDSVDKLRARWEHLKDIVRDDRKPRLLEESPDLLNRLLRDCEGQTRFALDDRAIFLQTEKQAKKEYPDLQEGLLFHDADISLFEDSGIEEQIEEALSRRVELPRGGNIAIDRTEALTVIDVNMGSATAQGDDAIFQVNKVAAEEAARQIMLRNLSGLIVIDFISMKNKGRLKRLIETLRSKFLKDSHHTDVLGLTGAGLMEIT